MPATVVTGPRGWPPASGGAGPRSRAASPTRGGRREFLASVGSPAQRSDARPDHLRSTTCWYVSLTGATEAAASSSSCGSRALVGSFALAGAFGGEFRQDYLQPGSESRAASDTLKEKFPQRSGDTVQVVMHAEAGVVDPEVQARAEQDLRRRRAQRATSSASPARLAEGGGQISDGRHDGVRRRRARHDRQRVHARARPRRSSIPSSTPATTPCRSRSAARWRLCRRPSPSARRASD